MNTKRHLLVIDPTAYAGGSKIATENILRLLNNKTLRITVLTADKSSWHGAREKRVQLFQFKWLSKQDQGIAFFLRHIVIALNIFILRLRLGKIDIALGASGPGVDLSLYLIKYILNFKVVQLIHGPVALSRTLGHCLCLADEIHYLESTESSLLLALSKKANLPLKKIPDNFYIFRNGLSDQEWPAPCEYKRPIIFWAASLLKWKGLETLLNALQKIASNIRPETHICYIRPKETSLPVSLAPINIETVHWHESPRSLGILRSYANIFVSTSQCEPFGLSILEAMAAGHCILIPADGAYWDCILEDNINCIKYIAGDANDLAMKLTALSNDMHRVKALGIAASNIAFDYRAEIQYAHIKHSLETIITTQKAVPKHTYTKGTP